MKKSQIRTAVVRNVEPQMAADALRLRYIRCVKGQYWYFRSTVTGDVRLPGQPGDAEFHRAYAILLRRREERREIRKARKIESLPDDYMTPQEHAARSREVERAWLEARAARKAEAAKSRDE